MRYITIAVLVVTGLAAGPVHAVSVGITAFGGPSFPIVQDDNGTGAQFGVRVPIGLVPFVSVEPYYARSNYGDASETFAGTEYARSGYDMNVFGVNLGLGSFGVLPGFPLYPYVGIGSHSLSRDGSDDMTEVGYNFGLGLGVPLPAGLSINVRGELNVIDLGDTSRKFIHATANIGYRFMGLP
jgi:hypothetical protein